MEFDGEDLVLSLVDAVKFHILTCGAAALPILYTGRGRTPYLTTLKRNAAHLVTGRTLVFKTP